MNGYEKLEKLDAKEFKLITGITREVFDKMLACLEEKYAEDHAMGGRPGLSVGLRLTLALEYWREYRSQRHMAHAHSLSKSAVNQAIAWVEYRLEECEEFQLADLKERFKPEKTKSKIKIIIADVTEQPIERPVHEQEASYSGKKNVTRRNIR